MYTLDLRATSGSHSSLESSLVAENHDLLRGECRGTLPNPRRVQQQQRQQSVMLNHLRVKDERLVSSYKHGLESAAIKLKSMQLNLWVGHSNGVIRSQSLRKYFWGVPPNSFQSANDLFELTLFSSFCCARMVYKIEQ